MAKYHGIIGFTNTIEDPPGSGIWISETTERSYSGDLVRESFKNEPGEKLNDNINISNRISIVADSYAIDNFSKMTYVSWMGALWKINSIEVSYPRLTLSIGGVYNGTTT